MLPIGGRHRAPADRAEVLGKGPGALDTVSHHLKTLSEAGTVHADRRGRWVWYSLDRDRLADLRAAALP
jgi:DNA-binding transcriptional ArsR family regulator